MAGAPMRREPMNNYADRQEHVPPSGFITETLSAELHQLTLHLVCATRTWHRASQALRTGDLAAQNSAIDQLVVLREEWTR
jgi:hypothetical protein